MTQPFDLDIFPEPNMPAPNIYPPPPIDPGLIPDPTLPDRDIFPFPQVDPSIIFPVPEAPLDD